MSTTPTLQWAGLHYLPSNNQEWTWIGYSVNTNGTIQWGSPPPTVTMPRGLTLSAVVAIIGTAGQITFQGNTTAGSGVVSMDTSLSGGLYIGQPVTSLAFGGSPVFPTPLAVASTNLPSTITLNQDAEQAVAFATFIVQDTAPAGYFVVSVNPSTGVTLTDQNSDGNGDSWAIGNATLISNVANQAEGGVQLTPANPGNYTVAVTYASTDPNYTGATLSPALSLIVT